MRFDLPPSYRADSGLVPVKFLPRDEFERKHGKDCYSIYDSETDTINILDCLSWRRTIQSLLHEQGHQILRDNGTEVLVKSILEFHLPSKEMAERLADTLIDLALDTLSSGFLRIAGDNPGLWVLLARKEGQEEHRK